MMSARADFPRPGGPTSKRMLKFLAVHLGGIQGYRHLVDDPLLPDQMPDGDGATSLISFLGSVILSPLGFGSVSLEGIR